MGGYPVRFYWKVLQKAARNRHFRAQAVHELWEVGRQYLPARLTTRRRDYVYCRYLGSRRPGRPGGRWVAPQSLKYRLSAYGLLFDRQGRVLLVSDPSLNFGWNPPGGGINKGETITDGLKREFEEETGLLVEPGPVVAVRDNFLIMPTGRAVHAVLHFYLVRPVGGLLNPEGNGFDTTQAEFLDLERLPKASLHDSAYLRELVRYVRQAEKPWAEWLAGEEN